MTDFLTLYEIIKINERKKIKLLEELSVRKPVRTENWRPVVQDFAFLREKMPLMRPTILAPRFFFGAASSP
jgi:hypothetical protein